MRELTFTTAIRTSDGSVYKSDEIFYHCIVAYENYVDPDTITHCGRSVFDEMIEWDERKPYEDARQIIKCDYEKGRIPSKDRESILKFYKHKL